MQKSYLIWTFQCRHFYVLFQGSTWHAQDYAYLRLHIEQTKCIQINRAAEIKLLSWLRFCWFLFVLLKDYARKLKYIFVCCTNKTFDRCVNLCTVHRRRYLPFAPIFDPSGIVFISFGICTFSDPRTARIFIANISTKPPPPTTIIIKHRQQQKKNSMLDKPNVQIGAERFFFAMWWKPLQTMVVFEI